MKIELIGKDIIQLTGETSEEIYLLKKLAAQGIRVSGRSSYYITVCSPELADLQELLIDREETKIFGFALGIVSTIELIKQLTRPGVPLPASEALLSLIEKFFHKPETVIPPRPKGPVRGVPVTPIPVKDESEKKDES